MQRGDRPGEGDAESLELPDVNTCRLVSCVNALHFNPATAVCMQRAHWVARAACVVGADTAHTESFRLWRNNRIAPLIRLVRGPALSKTQVAETAAHPNLWGARGRCDVPGCGACERPIRTAIRLGGIHLREKQLSCHPHFAFAIMWNVRVRPLTRLTGHRTTFAPQLLVKGKSQTTQFCGTVGLSKQHTHTQTESWRVL